MESIDYSLADSELIKELFPNNNAKDGETIHFM
jgi:hypothetical protein